MKRSLVACISALMLLSASAQPKHGIVKAHAFYKVFVPGTQLADEVGMLDTLSIVRVIYLETKPQSQLQVDTVWYFGSLYSAAVFAADEREIGTRKSDGRKISLVLPASHKLWRLELAPEPMKKRKKDAGRIIIKGKDNGKSFQHEIRNHIELEPDIRN